MLSKGHHAGSVNHHTLLPEPHSVQSGPVIFHSPEILTNVDHFLQLLGDNNSNLLQLICMIKGISPIGYENVAIMKEVLEIWEHSDQIQKKKL